MRCAERAPIPNRTLVAHDGDELGTGCCCAVAASAVPGKSVRSARWRASPCQRLPSNRATTPQVSSKETPE